MNKRYTLWAKILILLLLPIAVITSNPIKAKAHDAYFIQVLLDPSSMTFQSTVEHDNLSFWKGMNNALEADHRESKFGDYSYLKSNTTLDFSKYGDKDTNKGVGVGYVYNPYFVFTFPSVMEKHSFAGIEGTIRNHANGEDSDRAYQISSTLTNNLNQVLSILFGGSPAPSYEELESAVQAILTATGSGKKDGVEIKYNTWTLTPDGNNLIISNGASKHTVLGRMVKGYTMQTLENGKKSPVYAKYYDAKEDVHYISMGMLAAQGLHLYKIHESSVQDMPEGTNQSVIAQKFKEFVSEIIMSVRNVLGLKSVEQMMFDTNGAGTYGGIMSNGWFKVATTFHLVFQAIAWSLITIAIVKILVQNNFATINVYSRISMMESIKKLLMTAVLLVSSMVIVNLLAKLNTQFVSIFATMRGDKTLAENISNYNTLGTVIMSFYYLIVTIYFNFVYIMRGITVAVLIASAPLFIISIPFASAESKLFVTWAKELISNIFLQSFHAFVFALTLSMSATSMGIETAVISFALIPLSSFFRNLITGGDTLSSRMQDGAGKGVLAAGAGLASTAMLASRFKGGKGPDMGGKAGGKESSFSGLNMESGMSDSNALGNYGTSKDTVDGMNITKKDIGQEGNINNKMSNDYHAIKGVDKPTVGSAIKSGGKKALKLGTGVAMATGAAGVGIGLATAGVSPHSAAMISGGMLATGAGMTTGTIKDMANDMRNNDIFDENVPVEEGTIVNAESLQNGNTMIERDRSKLYDSEGVVSANDTEEGNIAVTYDLKHLEESKGNKSSLANLNFVTKNYGTKDFNEDWFRRRGVDNVTFNPQTKQHTIHYNKVGKKEMGVHSMESTARRIKEVKRPSNSKTTFFSYNPHKVPVPVRNEEVGAPKDDN